VTVEFRENGEWMPPQLFFNGTDRNEQIVADLKVTTWPDALRLSGCADGWMCRSLAVNGVALDTVLDSFSGGGQLFTGIPCFLNADYGTVTIAVPQQTCDCCDLGKFFALRAADGSKIWESDVTGAVRMSEAAVVVG
jgi:hypothetical protein